MQRRAAAMYFVFFLVLGAAAYSVVAIAEEPSIDLDGETYGEGDTLTVAGQEYTVTSLESEEADGGDHGGGGGETTFTGELTTRNESARQTAELENESEVTYEGGNYTVAIPNGTNVSSFDLQPSNDTEGEPLTFSEGDEFQYDAENVTATVDTVESSTVTLAWTAPENETIELNEGANVTLGDQQYVVHFLDENTVQLSTQVEEYQEQIRAQETFAGRIGGLWWVTMLSIVAAILVIALAYMPVRG